ncbi:hypothetical protein, partial [Pseudomonas sp. UBA3149]
LLQTFLKECIFFCFPPMLEASKAQYRSASTLYLFPAPHLTDAANTGLQANISLNASLLMNLYVKKLYITVPEPLTQNNNQIFLPAI